MTARLSVVLAVAGGVERLPQVLEALRPQCEPGVEVLVCHAEGVDRVREICLEEPWVTPVAAPLEEGGQPLVPHLWRDGILRAEAPRVALTVVHCRPEPGWISALLAVDLDRYAAVGGAIDNDPDSDALGWAVYLLRYLRYARPFAPRETPDLAADDVVYDRDVLVAHSDAFADGFWEPSVHALLLRDGHRLLLDPSIAVVHANGYGFCEIARARFAHGRRYGRDRAAAMPRIRQSLYLLLSPAAPLLLAGRILARALARPGRVVPRGALLRALPALAGLLIAWGAGESTGAFDALFDARRDAVSDTPP